MPEVYRFRDLAAAGILWSRQCLLNWEKEGLFPRRVPFGKQSAWRRSDVHAWLAAQSAAQLK
jgi:predicted DNA-binding transcriptional regulator AlpA